jgi:K(+)-stimulated pyrophosphate-energized sodium pump
MNLVALLIAPLVVEYADSVALRVAIAAVALLVVAGMVWVSKTRKSELDLSSANEGAPATTPA